MSSTDVQISTPQRTCIGCRVKAGQRDLLRLVLAPSGAGAPIVVVDERRRSGGRGAWLHPQQECLALVHRKRAFARAFRTAVAGDTVGEFLTHAKASSGDLPDGATVLSESGSEI